MPFLVNPVMVEPPKGLFRVVLTAVAPWKALSMVMVGVLLVKVSVPPTVRLPVLSPTMNWELARMALVGVSAVVRASLAPSVMLSVPAPSPAVVLRMTVPCVRLRLPEKVLAALSTSAPVPALVSVPF